MEKTSFTRESLVKAVIKGAADLSILCNPMPDKAKELSAHITNVLFAQNIFADLGPVNGSELRNRIMEYMVMDATRNGYISDDKPDSKVPFENYKDEYAVLYELNHYLGFSPRLYNIAGYLGRAVAREAADALAIDYTIFPYCNPVQKIYYAKRLAECFTHHAQKVFWSGLRIPDVYYDAKETEAYAYSMHVKDNEKMQENFELTGETDVSLIEHRDYLAVSPDGLDLPMEEFTAIIVHECIHNMIAQFNACAVQAKYLERLPHTPVTDTVLFFMRTLQPNLSNFEILYAVDHEEEICRRAENETRKPLQRFNPSNQLICLPDGP